MNRSTRNVLRSTQGSVLLEVVLALVLFVGAASVITGGFQSGFNSVERQRMQAHALNLAITVISELQMGTRSLADLGPAEFEKPFEGWNWELASAPSEPARLPPIGASESTAAASDSVLARVEVVIRHPATETVYRLAGVVRAARSAKLDGKGFGPEL